MSVLKLGTLTLATLATFTIVLVATSVPLPEAPRLGYRGAERQRALRGGGLFALVEPLIRFVAGLVALLPIARLRQWQDRDLLRAGHCLGLTPDEYSGLCILSALGLGSVVLFLLRAGQWSLLPAIPAAMFGAILPVLQVQEIIRRRAKDISRALPHAIEIAAMCMSAGLDFPGSLRLLAERNQVRNDALARELSLMLEELELGRTRREALMSFAERVPTDAVRDFAHAIIQAEERGNPLAKVIQVQGRMLSMKRSVVAEEAAARAGVLMVVPLVLLLGCILVLLMGPFLVNGVGF